MKTNMLATGTALIALTLAGFNFAGAQNSAEPAVPLDIQDVESGALVFANEAEFRARVRAYLLEEPEVLIEAMQVLEQRRAMQEAKTEQRMISNLSSQIFDDGFSFVGGNPNGDITVVEFQDYRCGYCKRAHGEVQELIESDGNIRLIIKEFPILGPDSDRTSQMAIATMITQGPEAYKRISDALMTYGGPINDSALDRIARSVQIDFDAVTDAMNDPEVARRIDETRQLGRQLAISGTPTFIVGTKMVRGYLPLADMREVVALSRSVAGN